jgi:sorbitol-specific phosphotransferase system component IIBC
MLESVKTLLQSKRATVAFITALVDVLLLLGVTGIPEQTAEVLATLATTIGGLLIAGYTATDAAKAVQLPPGTGHK